MSQTLKTAALSALVAAVVCMVGFWLVGGNQPAVGGSTRFPNSDLSAKTITSTGAFTASGAAALNSTVTVGSSGDSFTRINQGTCNIHAGATTIAATSTVTFDCQAGTGTQTALTNYPAWQSGDTVFVMPATTTPNTIGGLHVNAANSSSTAGFITVDVTNLTGDTFTWTAAASSTWQYLLIR